MLQDANCPPEFKAVTEPDEKILWTGRPLFWPFVLHAVPIVAVGAIWGAMDFGIFSTAASNGQTNLLLYAFFIFHSFPAWGSIV